MTRARCRPIGSVRYHSTSPQGTFRYHSQNHLTTSTALDSTIAAGKWRSIRFGLAGKWSASAVKQIERSEGVWYEYPRTIS